MKINSIANLFKGHEKFMRERETRERSVVSTPLQPGDRIRRLKDGRVFRLTVINFGGTNGGVFSAVSDDGEWGDWGGPITRLIHGETFDRADS